MNILFYTVSNKRSRDIESQAIEFARVGHRIFLLTQSPRSELHDIFEFKGFRAFDTNPSKGIFPLYLIGEIIKLVIFCYRHKITIVHSHLDPCNLVAVCSQLLLRAKVIVNRHHADALMYEASKKSQRISLWIYQRARYIIVVSENVKSHMVNEEGIKAKNVTVIPLSFNFELYDLPTEKETQEIRKKYATPLLLCTAGRFISLKRIDLIIHLVHRLNKIGINAGLIILGSGSEEENLKRLSIDLGIGGQIFFEGFTNHVLPYMAAADYYIHFSMTEASCTTVKEAGLTGTPVIVCENVGDFNKYISPQINGFFVNKDRPIEDTYDFIVKTYRNKELLVQIGSHLKNTVLNYFDIKRVMPLYDALHQKILKN